MPNLEARELYRTGDYQRALQSAQAFRDINPTSAGAIIVMGDSFRRLGNFMHARGCYTDALQILTTREQNSQVSEDAFSVERRLVDMDCVLGRYDQAHTRALALAGGGRDKFSTLMAQDFNQTRNQVLALFRKGKYKDVVSEARNFLILKGRTDTEVELVLANSLVMSGKDTPIDDLAWSHRIARRLIDRKPRNSQAWSILGLTGELILEHPQKKDVMKEESRWFRLSEAAVISHYRKALELDPSNQVARERYKALTGKEFRESRLRNIIKTGYIPSLYLPSSPRLKHNSEAKLKENQEVEWYWDQHSKEYQQFIDALDAQIGTPMDNRCRVAICIPAFMEEKNIYRTLSNYLGQDGVDTREFEIIVLENHPNDPKYKRDNTTGEIDRFRNDHPELKVHSVYHRFPIEAKAMGNIRKTVFDLAVRRGMKRGHTKGELILGSNDADFYGMKSGALQYVVDSFDSESQLDLLSGKYDYPPEALIKFPTVHAVIRFARYYSNLEERYFGVERVGSSGACTFFRAKTYASSGGYDFKVERGSDSEMGMRIAYYRRSSRENRLRSTNALRFYTDPRRALSKMVLGGYHVDQWKDKKWQEDPRVMGKSWHEFEYPTLTTLNMARLEEEINAFLNKRLSHPHSSLGRRQLFLVDRAMRFLKIGYKRHGAQINITDISELEKDIEKYKAEHSETGAIVYSHRT